MRNGASAWTNTRLMRPSVSRKLLTYCEPQVIENVWSMSLRLTPKRARLLAIDVDLERRAVVQPVRPHQREARILPRQREQLVARLHQPVVADPAAILELEIEARRRPELADRRRIDGNDDGVLVRRETLGVTRPTSACTFSVWRSCARTSP